MAKHVDPDRPASTQDPNEVSAQEALREIRKLYLRWEQEFTGVGLVHDVVQEEIVAKIRDVIEEEMGEDWY